MSVTPNNTTGTTTAELRELVVADAVKYARRECMFLLVYEYKDFFDHTVWATVSEGEQRPID